MLRFQATWETFFPMVYFLHSPGDLNFMALSQPSIYYICILGWHFLSYHSAFLWLATNDCLISCNFLLSHLVVFISATQYTFVNIFDGARLKVSYALLQAHFQNIPLIFKLLYSLILAVLFALLQVINGELHEVR